MIQTKNLAKLKPKERELLKQLVSKSKENVRKITRCRIPFLTDDRKMDTQIIEALDIARNTIRQVPQRYAEHG
jgi:putative transposase